MPNFIQTPPRMKFILLTYTKIGYLLLYFAFPVTFPCYYMLYNASQYQMLHSLLIQQEYGKLYTSILCLNGSIHKLTC